LLKEKQIITANEEKKSSASIEQLIRAIPDFNLNHAAVYTQFACVSAQYGVINHEDYSSSCNEPGFSIESANTMDFFSMLHAELPQDNVPCNTTDSKLRDLYNQIRSHDQCADTADTPILRAEFKYISDSAEQLIRMIYFSNVLSNFEKIHKDDLTKLAAIEAEHQPGFPELNLQTPFACGSNPGISRPQITQWIRSLENSENSLSGDEKKFVNGIQSRMETQLSDMNCVPQNWIELVPGETPEDASSACFNGGANP